MSTTLDETPMNAFADWLDQSSARRRIRGRHQGASRTDPGLRFAFYGRTSTGRFQDLASSRAWQLENAVRTIAGHGHIVAEFFDVGSSRSLPWRRRPQATALPREAVDPQRGFDAIGVPNHRWPAPRQEQASAEYRLASQSISGWQSTTTARRAVLAERVGLLDHVLDSHCPRRSGVGL